MRRNRFIAQMIKKNTGIFIYSFFFSLLSNFILIAGSFAQTNNPFTETSNNFYEIQKQFESIYNLEKNADNFREWKQYKRWEWFMMPRVYPTGNLPDPMAVFKEINKTKSIYREYRSSGNWISVGPNISSGNGIGRINFICIHPSDSNIMFAGAPSGGLWKSVDGGASWTTNTDNLGAIGFSDMVINPQNPQIMYAASSDGDANDTYSLGVLKSTDGGATWQLTGLNFNVTQTRTIRRIIMHPGNPDILYCASNNGIYKTVNAGTSWTKIYNSGAIDIEFKPGNPNVIYAAAYAGSWTAGAKFIKSTDGGASFNEITGAWTGKSNRIAIAVTSADTNYVYIVASESPTSNNNNRHGFYGFYKSSNGGDSFVTQSTTPNILGWSPTGNDQKGQGWYDLDVAASPVYKDLVFVGGVNIWNSFDGGVTWNLSAHWYAGGGAPYVHADIHWLSFDLKSPYSLYVGCDGGAYFSKDNGVTYKDISQTMVTSQIYRLGISQIDPKLTIIGLQDNGSKLLNTSWSNVLGGDGMECLIDPSDNKIMYGSLYYGAIKKSTNGGSNFNDITGNISEEGGWVTPFMLSPKDPKKIYAGFVNVWVNNNRGIGNWYKLGSLPGTSTIVALKVAPSDTSVIYVAKSSAIYISRNSGQTWKNINSGLPTGSVAIESIEVREDNPNVVWVTFSGYYASNKVFVSTDGGDNWINYSGNLPNIPVNCIVYQKGSDNGLYVGTDAGVYYRDSTLSDWIPFSDGMPNVIVNELEIFYNTISSKQRIKAATYGRGLWESELYYPPNKPPFAEFDAPLTSLCAGYTITFNNTSTSATSFKWYFPGGEPATSTDRNPRVRYDLQGAYTVHLVAFNNFGKDSIAKVSYINVDGASICEYTMPSLSSGDIYTTCNGILLDPGGNNNYTSNLNSIITIAPPNATSIVFTFTDFDTEKDVDILEMFEGSSVSSTKIGQFSGSVLPGGGRIVVNNGVVTFRFSSDALDNRSGFKCEWHCLKPTDPPFAYFTPESVYSCDGYIKFVNQTLNNPTNIFWDFGDGETGSESNPRHFYKKNGWYTVKLKVSNPYGSDSFIVSNLVVDIPDGPKPIHNSVCGSNSVKLSAESEGNIYWYSAIIDTLAIHKGKTFTTPALTSSRSYYIRKFLPGPEQYIGAYSSSIGTGNYNTGSAGLYFHAYKDLIIKSVKVFAYGDAKRTIQLKDSSGNIILDTSVQIPNGESRIILNFYVPKGNFYSLYCLNASMYRNTGGAKYPYIIQNLISIYSSTSGTAYYNFFYDWEIQQQDVCKSDYVEVKAGVYNTAANADFNYSDSGLFIKFINTSTDNFFNHWNFGDGNTSFEASPVYKYTKGGSFDVKLLVTNACGSDSVTKTILITNGINEAESIKYLVYPNPNQGNFKFEYDDNDLIEMRMLDLNGQILINYIPDKVMDKYEKEFSIKVPSGMYFIQMISSESTITEKLFIK